MEKSASVSVCSAKKRKANLVFFPYSPQHLQLSHDNGIVISTPESNERPRLPKPQAESKPTAAAEENNSKKRVPYFHHENNDLEVVSKARLKVSLHFQPQKGQSLSTVNKQERDNGSSRIKKRASMKYAGKNEKKKCFIDVYMRKSRDNIWIPPRSVHVLLQEEHSNDIWEVFILCILLNKTTGTQAKKVLQDIFEMCPNTDAAMMVESDEIKKVICFLGLAKKCSEMIQQFSEVYLSEKMHVNDLHGIGMLQMHMPFSAQVIGRM